MEDRAAKLLKKWRKTLRLNDWDIKTVTVEKDWRKSGDIKIDLDNRMAALMLHVSIPEEHLEEVVVHELLHLKLYRMDQMLEESLNIIYGREETKEKELAYGLFMLELETTVEDLTKSMLTASDNRTDFWYKQVDRQVEEELGR